MRLIDGCGRPSLFGTVHFVGFLQGSRSSSRAVTRLADIGGAAAGDGTGVAPRVRRRRSATRTFLIRSGVRLRRAAPLRGARVGSGPLPEQVDYQTVQRTVSKQGAIQIAGQRMQVGYTHARKIVTVHVYPHRADIYDDNGTPLRTITRTNSKEVTDYTHQAADSCQQA